MCGFDTTEQRLRAGMFLNGNRVAFERPVDDAGQAWWIEQFFETHKLTPEDMGDLLTRSIIDGKSITYRFIDGVGETFSLRVEGRLRDVGDVWFVERTLKLSGNVFNADEMFIPPDDAGAGRGRRLMADLIATSKLLEVQRITLQARQIGRYAWLRMGFRPDAGSWRDLRRTLMSELFRFEEQLGTQGVNELTRRIAVGQEETANFLAGLDIPVPSPRLRDGQGRPVMVPLGKALFLDLAGDWDGVYTVGQGDMDKIAKRYVEGGSRD